MAVAVALGFFTKMALTQLTVAGMTALMETGVSISQQALMNKFSEWGVDTNDNSALNQFLNNFKDNLSAGVQMAVMTQSMALTNSLVDPIEDKYNAQLQTVKTSLQGEINKAKNKVGKNKMNFMAKNKLNKLNEIKNKNIDKSLKNLNSGTQFANSFSSGSSGMEQAYNSKNLENLNLQGMDPSELAKIVNQLLVAQKVG